MLQDIWNIIPSNMRAEANIFDLAELIVLVAAAGLAYWQLLVHRQTVKSEHTKDLILQVLESELIRNFETPPKANNIWGKSITKIEAKKNNPELNKILNFFENIAVFVKKGLVDEALLLETLAPMMIQYYKWSKHYLVATRRPSGREHMFVQYEELMKFWHYARQNDIIRNKIETPEKSISRLDITIARMGFKK